MKRKFQITGALVALLVLTGVSMASPQKVWKQADTWAGNLDRSTLLTYEGVDRHPAGMAAPQLIDLDYNGTEDLAMGSGDGMVIFFTNSSPSEFMADYFSPIYNSEGIPDFGDDSTVLVGDWHTDQTWEILVGNRAGELKFVWITSYFPMDFFVFDVVDVNGDPILADGGYSAPTVGDLNNDGLPDLLLGNGDGKIQLYINVGEPGLPAMAPAGELPIDVGSKAAPTVADLDGDGLLDLVVGNGDGEVTVCAGTKAPASSAWSGIVRQGPCWGLGTAGMVGSDAKPTIGDLDHDGQLDLVIGTGDGRLIWVPGD